MKNSKRSYRKLGLYIEEYSHRNKLNEDIPVYSVTNSKGFCKEFFNKEVASQDKSTYKLVPRGCFAYNPSRVNVGSIAWQNEEDRVIVSPLYNIFKVSDELDKDYLLYYLKSNSTIAYIDAISRGTVRSNLRMSVLSDFLIPYYTVEKQHSIVSELDAINDFIKLLQSQVSDLNALIHATFYDMFGDPITNPKGWDKVPLGDFCNEIKYGTSNPSCENGKFKYLRMCNLSYDGYLDLTDLKRIDIPEDEVEKCIVRKGDILFNRTNSMELIGKTCMFDKDEPMIIAGYIIRVRLNDKLNPVVMARMFNLPSIKKLMKSMAKGAVNQANINSKELSSIMVPVLPLPLQQSFASKVSTIEEAKSSLNSQISEMQTLLAARMQYWFV